MVLRYGFVLAACAVAGCGALVGIKELDVDPADSGPAPIDAGPDASATPAPFVDGGNAVIPDPPPPPGCFALGPNFPRVVTQAGGDNGWSTLDNVKALDGMGAEVQGCCSGNNTNQLIASSFGFNLLPGDQIQGIKVLITAREAIGGTFQDIAVQLGRVDIDTFGDNLAIGNFWPVDYGTRQYGGPNVLWSANPTPELVNKDNFAVIYVGTKGYVFDYGGGPVRQYVDAVQMTIYYCRK